MGDHANPLIKQLAGIPVNLIGRVSSQSEEGWRVELDGGECLARCAASCLLQPEPGDTVLLCGPHAACFYIMAVLERNAGAPLRLHLGEKAVLSASASISLASDELLVRARSATTLIDQMSSFGREFTASISRVKLIGKLFESFLERVCQFAGESQRTVEGIDQVRSGTIDHRAEQSLSLRGSEVIATAKTLVKVDGGQIHIG